ncbi:MAG: thioredoxin domain-containing protein [Thermoleophilia bacterium]|nr:thioredoxin domain-containing protein [Thermoleophilia bacterium]
MDSTSATTDTDALDVDARDHLRPDGNQPVTVIIYGDFQCPFTAHAVAEMRHVLEQVSGQARYAFRHFPLPKHPDAYAAALAAEIAASHGRFWEMHDLLFAQHAQLERADLHRCAQLVGIDAEAFDAGLRNSDNADRVERDVASGTAAGVTGTPTFFINGAQHFGDHSVELIVQWVRESLD